MNALKHAEMHSLTQLCACQAIISRNAPAEKFFTPNFEAAGYLWCVPMRSGAMHVLDPFCLAACSIDTSAQRPTESN